MENGVNIFISYAHEDISLLKDLEKHLSQLKWQGLITTWHDRDISAGTEWEQEIDTHLNTAQIILLLISPDFMASKYCLFWMGALLSLLFVPNVIAEFVLSIDFPFVGTVAG